MCVNRVILTTFHVDDAVNFLRLVLLEWLELDPCFEEAAKVKF